MEALNRPLYEGGWVRSVRGRMRSVAMWLHYGWWVISPML